MRTFLYAIVLIFLIGWLLGAFVWHIGSVIHLLLVVAVIVLIFNLIKKE